LPTEQKTLFPVEEIPIKDHSTPLEAWAVASWWQGGWWKFKVLDNEKERDYYLKELESLQGHGKKLIFKLQS